MLDLSNVTIVTANCVRPIQGVEAIRYSQKGIKFKEAILFTDQDIRLDGIKTITIPSLHTVDMYNDFLLGIIKYIDPESDFVLIVQDDGFVTNPEMWDPEFLKFDFLGAPWPKEQSWIDLQVAKDFMQPGFNQIGNGGFSLRSRKFLELSAKFNNCAGYGEDCFLNTVNYGFMWAHGIKYPPVELAQKFSIENNLDNWQIPLTIDPKAHFGFHGKNFVNSRELIDLKEQYKWEH